MTEITKVKGKHSLSLRAADEQRTEVLKGIRNKVVRTRWVVLGVPGKQGRCQFTLSAMTLKRGH